MKIGDYKLNINDIFNKIYVLTIKRNADRHPTIKTILKKIHFEFWYGLDAKITFTNAKSVSEIDDSFFESNNVDKGYVSRLTIGQFGAYFSITKLIKHIAENNFLNVLAFEDDIKILRNDWEDILLKAIQELPPDWDLLLLGYNYDGIIHRLNYKRSFRLFIQFYDKCKSLVGMKNIIKSPVKFSMHLDISGYSMGGHAYCISKKGAQILSEHLTIMRDSGDILFSDLILKNKINAFSVYPCLFAQDSKFGSKTNVA